MDLLRICIRFGVAFGVFLVPWPGVETGYASALRSAGNTVFGHVGGVTVVFRPLIPVQGGRDTEIVVRSRTAHREGRIQCETRSMGYLPTAFFVALAVAIPGGRYHRWHLLIRGGIAMHVFILVRVAIPLLLVAASPGLDIVHLGSASRRSLLWLENVIASQSSSSFVVPFVIWVAMKGPRSIIESLANSGVSPVHVAMLPPQKRREGNHRSDRNR